MRARLRHVRNRGEVYDALMFVCPGCAAGGPEGYDGLHLLPVNTTDHQPSWNWNGSLEKPTLSPSILTRGYSLCHSYLVEGVFEFLSDSDHPLAGKKAEMPILPEWALIME